MLDFEIGFICHLRFDEASSCGPLESIEEVVLVEAVESVVEALLNILLLCVLSLLLHMINLNWVDDVANIN